MQMRAKRSRGLSGDYWPGFVDALATLLLVLIFLISIFVLAQFYLGQALSGRDAALAQLNAKITELGELLDLAEKKNEDLESNILQLTSTLTETQDLVAERDESISAISALLVAAQSAQQDAEGKLEGLRSNLDEERQISAEAQAQITLLNEQMAALRLQLASLQDALEAAEARDAESKAVIETSAKDLMQPWRKRSRNWRVIVPNSLAASRRHWVIALTSRSSAIALSSNQVCCSNQALQTSAPKVRSSS